MASATPDLQLPSQPQGITAPWLVPNYTAWWQRHVCEQLAQGCYLKVERPGVEPATFCVTSQHPKLYTIRPHLLYLARKRCCIQILLHSMADRVQACRTFLERQWWNYTARSVKMSTFRSRRDITTPTVPTLAPGFRTCCSWSIPSTDQNVLPTSSPLGQRLFSN